MAHTFYKTDHLNYNEKRNLLLKAKELAYNWWVDILDCSKSFCRQEIEMSFDEILSKFNDKCLFALIHRKSEREDYLEVSFSTMNIREPEYFLWIQVSSDLITKIIPEN